jgi:hypothetical protein
LSYEDKNHDGILSTSEIVFDPNLSYEGSGTPRYNNTYSTSVGLLNGVVRINASFDHVIGLSTLAQFGMIGKQCQVDATCTLAEQAETMVAAMRGSASTGGAVYQTNTLRFQELSVTYNLSPSLAARLARARSASVTFAGRNLHLWTDYLGKDPDIDLSAGSLEFGTDNGTGLAQPRNWTFRVNLGY